MKWVSKLWLYFQLKIKYAVAGREIDALNRYREACFLVLSLDTHSPRSLAAAKWINRHGESMQSEMGRHIHIAIGKKLLTDFSTSILE